MDTPEAFRECAQLLSVAAHALKRLTKSDGAKVPVRPDVEHHLDEICVIAGRLEELAALISPALAEAAKPYEKH